VAESYIDPDGRGPIIRAMTGSDIGELFAQTMAARVIGAVLEEEADENPRHHDYSPGDESRRGNQRENP